MSPRSAAVSTGPELDEILDDVGYHRFADLLRASGLAAELSGRPGPFTVLVPDVSAFEVYVNHPDTPNPDELVLIRGLLSQHVIEGRHDAQEVAEGVRRTLLPQVHLEPGAGGDLVNVNRSRAVPTGPWWWARNGNVVEVDGVFDPALSFEHHLEQGGFNLFCEALQAVGYDRLADWQTKATVLVPTDEAFLRIGLDASAIHDPGQRVRVEAIVKAHILEPSDLDQLFEGGVAADDGAKVWIEPVYHEQDQREYETVFHDGEPRAVLHDDFSFTEIAMGVFWVLDGVMDPKGSK